MHDCAAQQMKKIGDNGKSATLKCTGCGGVVVVAKADALYKSWQRTRQ